MSSGRWSLSAGVKPLNSLPVMQLVVEGGTSPLQPDVTPEDQHVGEGLELSEKSHAKK